MTVLIWAAESGYLEVVKALMERYGDTLDINAKDNVSDGVYIYIYSYV